MTSCYLMSDGYAKGYRELIETTKWENCGRGRDERCRNCRRRARSIRYTVEDMAPKRVVNGLVRDEPNPTHTPRRDSAKIRLY